MSSPADDSSLTKPRVLILCFDGTANQYDDYNTNVVKFYSLLENDRTSDQLIYYQPGIGTYVNKGVVSPIFDYAAKIIDEAIAWYLDAHVCDGYRFLMDNYRAGDKVCLFGFSRGAYTARAVAGFLYKIGLLSKGSDEQIPLAYKLYTRTDKAGVELSGGFKKTFCRSVSIEFLGVWETVSSVGVIVGRNLPFTASNTAIKMFRQALALDEHRARFQPNLYHRTPPLSTTSSIFKALKQAFSKINPKHTPGTASADPEPPLEDNPPCAACDYKEVWFAGCHSDIGGGSVLNSTTHALSNITLQWMIRQVIQSGCGVLFNTEALLQADLDIAGLQATPKGNPRPSKSSPDTTEQQSPLQQQSQSGDTADVLSPIYDQLVINKAWWILEVVPTTYMYQDAQARWKRNFGFNLGKGRVIRIEHPKFHVSVKERMEDPKLKYTPKARWTKGQEVYVDE